VRSPSRSGGPYWTVVPSRKREKEEKEEEEEEGAWT